MAVTQAQLKTDKQQLDMYGNTNAKFLFPVGTRYILHGQQLERSQKKTNHIFAHFLRERSFKIW